MRWSRTVLVVALVSTIGCASRRPRTRVPAGVDVVTDQPYFVNFVPFGAGQFQNGDRCKGLGFAIGEGLTGLTSAGIWLYLMSEYGYSGAISIDDAPTVRSLQRIQIGTGIAFYGLYALGVVDSLLHYDPFRVRGTPVTIGPVTVPGGGGLGVSWSQ